MTLRSPDWGTPRGREWGRDGAGGSAGHMRVGREEGPGRGRHSPRPPRPAPRPPAAPGSGRCRETARASAGCSLSTARASAMARATGRGRAHDCGHRAGVTQGRPRAPLSRPAPGRGPHRGPRRVPPRAKEQLRGLRLGVYSPCATRVLRLLARAPETLARPDFRTGRATGPFACAGCAPNHSALPRREMHSALPFPSAAPRRGAQSAHGSNRASPRVPVKLSERQRWPRARWAARRCAVRGLYPPWGQCQL